MNTAAYFHAVADVDRDFDLDIEVNDDLEQPFDFTGYSAECEIRAARSRQAPILATATVALSTGLVKVSMTKAVTSTVDPQEGWYDLAVTDSDGKTFNWLHGPFTFQGVSTDA